MREFKCYYLNFSAVIAALFCLLASAESKRHLKVLNFLCEDVDEKAGHFTECSVKPIKRDVSEINVQFKLQIIIDEGLETKIFMKKRGNARNPIIYNVTLNGCKFLRNRKRNAIANMFYKFLGLEEYSNLNHTCPYKEPVVFLKGFRMEEKTLSYLPVPYGEYVIGVHWFYSKKMIAKNEVSFVFYDEKEKPFI